MSDEEIFKAVEPNSTNYQKAKIGFFKGIFIPFVSGILGTTLVLTLYLKVPTFKSKVKEYLNIKDGKEQSQNIEIAKEEEQKRVCTLIQKMVQSGKGSQLERLSDPVFLQEMFELFQL